MAWHVTVSGKGLGRVIFGPEPHPGVTSPWLGPVSGWGTLGCTHSYVRSSRGSPPETTTPPLEQFFVCWLHAFPCHASRQVPCPHVQHHHHPVPRILSPIQINITDTQLTMGEQVSFTWFLCCACHDRGEGSAFFDTCRAAELHISRSAGCKNDSQLQEDHEAGPVGAPGHWSARPVPTASSIGASSYPTYAYDASLHQISVCIVSHQYMQSSISVYTDAKH
jgi:hypothetical protein